MIETNKFARKAFYVDAVQVTAENIQDVAQWSQGEVRTTGNSLKYVKVLVQRPANDRQTQAFIGDWVLHAGAGFKVYTSKAFARCFELVEDATQIQETPAFEPEDKVNPTFTHGDKRVEAVKNINRVTEAHEEKHYRDAGSGEYVTEDYAKSHPSTTVGESVHQRDASLG